MNRANADNQSAQAEQEGLEPTKEWVKDLVDEIIAEEFASPDFELHWLDEDDGDPETVLADRVKLGALTLNEMRAHLGLDPYANPAADRPMALTATGYVPIEAGAAGVTASAEVPSSKKFLVKAAADDPKHPGWPVGTPGGKGGQFRPKDGNGGEASSDSQNAEGAIARPYPQYAALESGTRTDMSPGPAGPRYASTNPPDISGALTGNSRTDDVTKKLAQIFADTLDALTQLPGQPQKYGTIVHLAFAAAVMAAGIREPMDIEHSFALPPDYPSEKRSVKPDIVLRNDSGDIVAIYDIKTGDSGIDPWRARELRAATGVGSDVPIIVMYTDEAILKNRIL